MSVVPITSIAERVISILYQLNKLRWQRLTDVQCHALQQSHDYFETINGLAGSD